ncbi:MAG TPA: Gfo/Idh/MocA family oxidoreductase [Acidimicrobiales bacterium]|jgi:predicted dehydrogenase
MTAAPDRPLALGLAGCGRLATAGYLPALAAVAAKANVRLVAVADPDPARRRAVAQAGAALFGAAPAGGDVATFPDAAALLAGARVDGLILASPAAHHVADAERATAAGVGVLVEKPPAPDAAGAAALAALSPAPWVGFNRRFDRGARAVRSAIRAAPANDLAALHLEIRYRRRTWNAHAVRDDALLDLGPHLVDWARWLTARPVVEVACRDLTTERVAAELTLAGGKRATLAAATDRPHAERITVRDAAGRILARHRRGGLLAGVAGRVGLGGANALVASLAGQLAAFAAALRGQPPVDLGTAADGHATMLVLEAIRASAAAGGRSTPVHDPAEVS